MKGIIAGIIAGIAGAIIWAVVAALTGFEIGWLAWGIGAAVGAAVAWGSEGSPKMGVIAVVIAVIAIIAGKFITVEMVLAKEMGTVKEEVAQQINDEEYLISWISDEIVYELKEQGETIAWPEGVDPEAVDSKDDYPPRIWNRAEQIFGTMSEDEKADYKESVRQQTELNIKMFADSVKGESFIASFGLFDALFLFLAIGTAYKVGSKSETE